MTAEMDDEDLRKLDNTLERRHQDGTPYNEIYGAEEVRALRERLRGAEKRLAAATTRTISNAEEERLEGLYWSFDAERKQSGMERDAFKGHLRRVIRETRAAAAEVVKHLSNEDGLGLGSSRIEKAITGERGD